MSNLIDNKEYRRFFEQVKEQIRGSQAKAALSVNTSLMNLYWHLGQIIVEKQKENSWGNGIIEQLANDLKGEFPKISGFSRSNLFSIRQFYLFYTSEKVLQAVGFLTSNPISLEKVQQLVGLFQDLNNQGGVNHEFTILRQLVSLIPWGHNLLILSKVKEPLTALFYVQQTIEHNWSRAVLSMQIEQNLFGRQGKAITNFKSTLSEQQALMAQQILKDPYNFNFLTLEPKVQELELEKQLTEHITKFLLELGKGFAFIGRQYSFSIGPKDYSIDLLFYHIRLRCFVVIDLKTTPFEPEYAGKMNFYLSAIDDLLKAADDQPSIGILLCKNKESLEVEYALRGINKPIGVSEFTFAEALPEELRSSIPTVEEFEKEISKLPELTN
jgi:predicted nuclease of restriction endonuclease-like (RecB) superfamily